MSYIGSTPTTQNFIAGTDQFTGNGSATNWTLSRFVNSPNDIEVVIANVVQNPTSYSVSGNTLTVSPAIGNGTAFYVRYLSTTLQSITIPPGTTVNGDWGVNGNLNFFGNARRITGDFSNATLANRVAFQTSTTNGSTTIMALPNGSGVNAQLLLRSSSAADNDSFGQVVLAGGTAFSIASGASGTGTFLPMTFSTGGSERVRVDTSGNVGIGTSSPGAKFAVSDGTVQIGLSPFSGVGYIGNVTNHPLGLFVNNNERFRINTDGSQLSVIPGGLTLSPAFSCRAWVNFNGTGTVAIRGSGNVSSITDNGTGNYTVNLTTAMPDSNFMIGTGPVAIGSQVGSLEIANYTTSIIQVITRYQSGASLDWSSVFISVHR